MKALLKGSLLEVERMSVLEKWGPVEIRWLGVLLWMMVKPWWIEWLARMAL